MITDVLVVKLLDHLSLIMNNILGYYKISKTCNKIWKKGKREIDRQTLICDTSCLFVVIVYMNVPPREWHHKETH